MVSCWMATFSAEFKDYARRVVENAQTLAAELARQVEVPAMVVFLNKVDMMDDPELG